MKIKTFTLKVAAITAATTFMVGCNSIPPLDTLDFKGITEQQRTRCTELNNFEYMETHYQALIEKKWDRHAMGCGALYSYQLASDSTFDIELKLEALGAQLSYFDVLTHYYPKLYKEGELNRELNALWRATRVRSQELIKSVENFEFILNEITLLKGVYILAQSASDMSVREQVKAAVEAKTIIDEAVLNNPESIDGLGLLISGILYQDLPSFMGGNTEKSIESLQRLRELSPNNLEAIRWLIQAQSAAGNSVEEKRLLTLAATIEPKDLNKQDYADLLLALGGMAKRYELSAALNNFKEKRQQLFSQSPYLLTRQQSATMGHGSVDPITGKDSHDL